MQTEEKFAIKDVSPDLLKTILERDRSDWDWETYVVAGNEASKTKILSQWILGKLADEVAGRWGEGAKYAQEIHMDEQKLRQYRWVYRQFTKDYPEYEPDGYLSWGVLCIVAQTNEPVQIAEELSANDIKTQEGAYRHIKQKELGVTLVVKPKLKLVPNQFNGLWKLEITDEDFKRIDWSGVESRLMDYLLSYKKNIS